MKIKTYLTYPPKKGIEISKFDIGKLTKAVGDYIAKELGSPRQGVVMDGNAKVLSLIKKQKGKDKTREVTF